MPSPLPQRQPTALTFWSRCVSLFHRFSYNGTFDDSLALAMSVVPLTLGSFQAGSFGPFVPSCPLLHYCIRVGGVRDSVT
jgi:hypothetical protein